MYVRNIDWPEFCRQKIGFRLNVKSIPILRFLNNITTVEKDLAMSIPDEIDNVRGGSETRSNLLSRVVCDPMVTRNCTTTASTYYEY